MQIQSSSILLTSQNVSLREQSTSESLRAWVGNRRPDFEGSSAELPHHPQDRVDFSPRAQSALQNTDRGKSHASGTKPKEDNVESDPVSMIIRMLARLITGKDITITSYSPARDGVDPQKAAALGQAANQAQSVAQPQAQPSPQTGFGLEYDSRETYLEAEITNFSALGVIRTADGRQIEFNLQLSMERLFVSEKSVSVRMGDAAIHQQDPLVINFDGSAAQLTDAKFSFDIDTDGEAEQISFTEGNSGFLALDKNNDGVINNGSELFGTSSGNGFADLSGYDQDGNGWIDDSDAVFQQLQVLSKDEQGNDVLTGLKASGVGALYLGNVSTAFELKNPGNDSLGTVRASGVYLAENGTVGTLQQVDLTL
ncbi:MAG TPA: hypothetical protein PK036_14050 [Geobacteraceae bacterium]|nr:hypothetical protein [Geobacteraceae bacterium]